MAGVLTITIVGMLTVFAFLIVLVLSMSLLRIVALRLPSGEGSGGLDTAAVAAVVASIHARGGEQGEPAQRSGGGR